jgi:hypothetical protein
MSTLPARLPLAQPDGGGLWRWLLRNLGLETWFQQPAATAHAGQVERIFLQLAPALNQSGSQAEWAAKLTAALAECRPAMQASGGEVLSQQGATLLLSWPAVPGSQQSQVVRTYFELCASMARQAGPTLCGAASLGWVVPSSTENLAKRYRGEVLRGVAGMLRAGQQLGSQLLISAALQHRLDAEPAYRYELDVAFEVAGHRYPVTVFRVSAA